MHFNKSSNGKVAGCREDTFEVLKSISDRRSAKKLSFENLVKDLQNKDFIRFYADGS